MNKKITSAIIIVAVIIAMIGVIFAEQVIPKELYDQYGILLVIVPVVILVIVLILIGSILDKSSTKLKKPKLEDRRSEITHELKEAEKKFLRHKIDKATFDNISKRSNAELISIESDIDSQKIQVLNENDTKKLEGVSRDKQKVLKGLLEQRQKKVHELKIAEKSYLKRKIDEKIYKQLNSKINEEIISIDGKIKAIQETEKIKQLEAELKNGAKEISKQQKSTEKRQKQLTEIELIEEDLLSQLT